MLSLIGSLSFLLAACEDYSAPYTRGFIQNLRAAQPARAECIEREVRRRWPSQAALYAAANEVRVVRGEGDVWNYVFRVLADVCPEH